MSAAGRAARSGSLLSSNRSEWNSFIRRCVRSWVAAQASASDFLAAWTPIHLSEPPQKVPSRPGRARRTGSTLRSPSRRRAHYPIGSAATTVPDRVAGGADALRQRYPLVSALLVELAAQAQSGSRLAARTQQRR
jgi:hypothetical protein